MRRKDGKPKLKARRTLPTFQCGFSANPATAEYIHPTWSGARSPQHHSVVSLFAGCGGLDLGVVGGFRFLNKMYRQLPFDIISAIDNNQDAVDTYNLNLGSHATLADLTTLGVESIARADVLMGGFPCQDFSSSGPKVGFSGKRGQLYQVLSEYMAVHKPKVVIGENVPHLARLSGGVYLETILKEFEAQGYRFDVWDLYAPDFGLPQSRRRLFLVGVRNDLVGYPVRPTGDFKDNHVPISAGIGDLENIVDESIPNQGQYYVATKATAGGGQGDHTNDATRVAYCIRANARGRIQFHYALERRLTVRECARLQSFPDEFVFPYTTQRNLTLIGNAVPPILGHNVASSVGSFLASMSQVDGAGATQASMNAVSATRVHVNQLALFDTRIGVSRKTG